MPHVLARLTGAPLAAVQAQLHEDAALHASQGMRLRHLWQDATDSSTVLFLFEVDDLDACRQRTAETHAKARREHPGMPLPEMTFLADA